MFKFRFLKDRVRLLNYRHYIWLDADSFFLRPPDNPLGALQGAPVHASLESDVCGRQALRDDWWGCPLVDYARLMREMGVRSRSIYNVNAGFWIIKREAVETVVDLAEEFYDAARRRGYAFTEEPPLAYVVHMLCGDVNRHNIRRTPDLWASDWTGVFAERLPDGDPWNFVDYISGERIKVNPAIVHAMRSKQALIQSHQLATRCSKTRPGHAR